MQGFVAPIDRLTEANKDFRRVFYTTAQLQLVLMALKQGEAIGSEIHTTGDQFFHIQKGKGRIRMGQAKIKVVAGDAFVVPAGVRHNLTNTGKKRLRFYTIYAPPNHSDHLVESTKAIAVAREAAAAVTSRTEAARKDMIDEGGPVAATIAATTAGGPI